MIVEWCPPPPRGPRNSRWSDVVAELQARPNEWAKVEHRVNQDAAYALVGYLRRRYRLETRPVRINGTEWAVWARWPA